MILEIRWPGSDKSKITTVPSRGQATFLRTADVPAGSASAILVATALRERGGHIHDYGRRVETIPTVSAYELADWSNFAVASAGAAAALTGLLFVAVSINLQRILELPQLPDRAGGTLGLLLTLLLVSIVLLAPGQPLPATGTEIATMSVLLACGAVLIALRAYRRARDRTLVAGPCFCCWGRHWPW